MPPREALELAAVRIDTVLAAEPPQPIEVAPPANDEAGTPIELWYCAHPILAPVLSYPEWLDELRREHSDLEFDVDTQYLGDWSSAVQKLSVNIAVDDPPDIALVERGWLAALAHAGRLTPLDNLLDPKVLSDLRAPFRDTLSVDGRLYALPADGFVTLLFQRAAAAHDQPIDTWTDLEAVSRQIKETSPETYPLGYMPFEEMLWSAGGTICDPSHSALRTDAAEEALRFLLKLRVDEALHPATWRSPLLGWQAFQRGDVPMTVASSKHAPALRSLHPGGIVSAVPGKSGAISRLSEFALVVFARHDPGKEPAIAAILDYLTGPTVQGQSALAIGSLPVRTSVAESLTLPPWASALAVARNTPLIAPWASVEHELYRSLARAFDWAEQQ